MTPLTATAPIAVLTVLAGVRPLMAKVPAGLHDIRGPLPPPTVFPFVPAVLLLAVALLLTLLYRRIRQGAHPTSPTAVGPAAAVDDLELLASAWQQGEITPQALFERLTPLVRQHIAAQAGVEHGPLTSQEIVRLAHPSPAAAELTGQLFLICDEVRFGNRPADTAAAMALAAARGVLDIVGTGRP